MQRCYLESLIGKNAILNKNDVHHLKDVVRLNLNEELEGVLGNNLFLLKVTCLNPFKVEVVEKLQNKGELENHITLYFALAKGEKNDLVVQKATELGVYKIVFVSLKRCIAKVDDFGKKKTRYENIALSASKQSRRMKTPIIEGVKKLADLQLNKEDASYFAYETLSGKTDIEELLKIKKGQNVNIFIGPEGGIAPEEATKLEELGFKAMSLGSRILRAETAAISFLSVLSYILER